MPLKRVYLSLGSNLGDRERNIEQALTQLAAAGVRLITRSSLYETAPQDVLDQAWFLNMAVEAETSLFPLRLMSVIQKIERELGRIRGQGAIRRGPRTIDIDILLFGSVLIETPQLTIPHPRMLRRRFVLEPLLEIAPQPRHPKNKEPLTKYAKDVADQKLRKLSRPQS